MDSNWKICVIIHREFQDKNSIDLTFSVDAEFSNIPQKVYLKVNDTLKKMITRLSQEQIRNWFK